MEKGKAEFVQPPVIIERFADNGQHSHWDLISPHDGKILWSEMPAPTPTDAGREVEVRELSEKLGKIRCPYCVNGISGEVSHEMALDACDRSLEGQPIHCTQFGCEDGWIDFPRIFSPPHTAEEG